MVDQGSGMLAGAAESDVSIRLKRPPPLPVIEVEPPPPVELASEMSEAAAERFCRRLEWKANEIRSKVSSCDSSENGPNPRSCSVPVMYCNIHVS